MLIKFVAEQENWRTQSLLPFFLYIASTSKLLCVIVCVYISKRLDFSSCVEVRHYYRMIFFCIGLVKVRAAVALSV
jgi:hypothetical protein